MSKVSMLKMLGRVFLVDFTAARIANVKKRIFPGQGKVIAVDLDGTLLSTTASLELLTQLKGEAFARERYEHYRGLVKNGKIPLERAHIDAHREVTALGVQKADYEKLVDRLISEGKVRMDVLEAAQYLHRIGRKVVIVTKGSEHAAELFSKRFGLDGGIGAVETFDPSGRLTGLKSLVGDRRMPNTEVKTKMQRLAEWCRAKKIPFSKRNVSIITDSYDDVRALRESGLGVLYVPNARSSDQKIAKALRLRDYEVAEVNPQRIREMKLAMRFPKAALRLGKKRLVQRMQRRTTSRRAR